MSNILLLNQIFSYLSIFIIFVGLIGNTISFIIFRFSDKFKKLPSMIFLSFVAVFDTLSLFEWNLDHFFSTNFSFSLISLNIVSCKIIVFMQFYSIQSSGILLSVMTIDRFVTIISTPGSLASRLPFSTIKSSFIWCISISIFLFIFNIHLLIFNGNYVPTETKNFTFSQLENGTYFNLTKEFNIPTEKCYWYTPNIKIILLWEKINMAVSSFIPFTIMLIFNILLIKKTLIVKKSTLKLKGKEELKAINKKKKLTISILSITFGFIIMTLPMTLAFGFFIDELSILSSKINLLMLIDQFSFLFHSSLFFQCFITNIKFRRYLLNYLKKNKNYTNDEQKIKLTEFSVIRK